LVPLSGLDEIETNNQNRNSICTSSVAKFTQPFVFVDQSQNEDDYKNYLTETKDSVEPENVVFSLCCISEKNNEPSVYPSVLEAKIHDYEELLDVYKSNLEEERTVAKRYKILNQKYQKVLQEKIEENEGLIEQIMEIKLEKAQMMNKMFSK